MIIKKKGPFYTKKKFIYFEISIIFFFFKFKINIKSHEKIIYVYYPYYLNYYLFI